MNLNTIRQLQELRRNLRPPEKKLTKKNEPTEEYLAYLAECWLLESQIQMGMLALMASGKARIAWNTHPQTLPN